METRFWSKVRRGADDECWEWLASKESNGYGQIKIEGKAEMSHRVAWILTHGEIPEGLIVRHKCRGKCCNPNHMELGTKAENNRDRVRDGTNARGNRNGKSILTEDQVRGIKRQLAYYETGMCIALAKEYGVSPVTITMIKTNRTWAWVTLEAPTQEPTGGDDQA